MLGPSAFNELLIRWNGLEAAGFAGWEFLPGMRFGERAAWWRDGVERRDPHEGLDLCWFRNLDGGRARLHAGARVPTVWAGEVVSLADDHLGVSVFVGHDARDRRGWRLHSIYGHLSPRPGLVPGTPLPEGGEIGAVAETSRARRPVPPHLHLTLALIDPAGGPACLAWEALSDARRVLLLDPLPIVAGEGR